MLGARRGVASARHRWCPRLADEQPSTAVRPLRTVNSCAPVGWLAYPVPAHSRPAACRCSRGAGLRLRYNPSPAPRRAWRTVTRSAWSRRPACGYCCQHDGADRTYRGVPERRAVELDYPAPPPGRVDLSSLAAPAGRVPGQPGWAGGVPRPVRRGGGTSWRHFPRPRRYSHLGLDRDRRRADLPRRLSATTVTPSRRWGRGPGRRHWTRRSFAPLWPPAPPPWPPSPLRTPPANRAGRESYSTIPRGPPRT